MKRMLLSTLFLINSSPIQALPLYNIFFTLMYGDIVLFHKKDYSSYEMPRYQITEDYDIEEAFNYIEKKLDNVLDVKGSYHTKMEEYRGQFVCNVYAIGIFKEFPCNLPQDYEWYSVSEAIYLRLSQQDLNAVSKLYSKMYLK